MAKTKKEIKEDKGHIIWQKLMAYAESKAYKPYDLSKIYGKPKK